VIEKEEQQEEGEEKEKEKQVEQSKIQEKEKEKETETEKETEKEKEEVADDYNLQILTKEIGNVFAETRAFFEYIICKERINNYINLKALPFQVQIHYTKLDGTQMLRVITQLKPITFDKKKAMEKLNINVLAKHATKVTTELCAKGDYEQSRQWTHANAMYMQKHANNDKQLKSLGVFVNDNVALDYQMKKTTTN